MIQADALGTRRCSCSGSPVEADPGRRHGRHPGRHRPASAATAAGWSRGGHPVGLRRHRLHGRRQRPVKIKDVCGQSTRRWSSPAASRATSSSRQPWTAWQGGDAPRRADAADADAGDHRCGPAVGVRSGHGRRRTGRRYGDGVVHAADSHGRQPRLRTGSHVRRTSRGGASVSSSRKASRCRSY